KEAIENKIEVIPVPGPSASICALSASGLKTGKFTYLGFLPKKAGKRRKALSNLTEDQGSVIIYESPHRLIKCLEDILAALGERRIVVAREMTKKFEEFKRGSTSEVLEYFKSKTIKGEVVILIGHSDFSTGEI
ncbi:SAM-dependent methyltransferase, partial [Candidatus Margulisiibacteriota bacterium]